MAPFEMYASATGQPDFVQPDFYSIPCLVDHTRNSGQLLMYNMAAPYSAMSYRKENFGAVVPGYVEPVEIFGPRYPEYCPPDRLILDSDQIPLHVNGSNGGQPVSVNMFEERDFREFIFSDHQRMGTEQDTGHSTLPTPSFESVQVSDSSTLVPDAKLTSSPEQEEDSAEELYKSLENITSWPALELYPAIEDYSFISASQVMLEGVATKENSRKRSTKLKYQCEIRISKKLIPKHVKYSKGKAWLGTFGTPDQKGRALDVGKFYLCTRKKKTFHDPNSEAILSAIEDHLRALPLPERVEKVMKLAKYYGEKGSLPESLSSL